MAFKSYRWYNPNLKRKSKNYMWLMMALAVVTVVCLYTLPEEMKMWNLLPLVGAMFAWWQSYKAQKQDNKLKANWNKQRQNGAK